MSDFYRQGPFICIILLFLQIQQLTIYVSAQGDGTGIHVDRQRCPTWPHLRARVRHGSDPSASMHCISPEEARLLREATQGMGGGRAPIGSSSGMSPMPGPSFPQPGIGSSVGRPSQGTPGSAVPGLFPGLESQPGQLDPFRSTGTGTSPTFPGSGPMRPGFQGTGTSPTFPGSGPMRPGFQGSSPVQPGFQGSSPVQPGFQGSSPVRPGFQGSSPMQPGIQGSMRPGFQGSMRPGFQGSDPSSPMFPGAPSFPGSSPSFPGSSPSFPGSSPSFAGSSPSFPGSSQSLPGSTNPFNPEVRPGGGPPTGMSDSGLMGARPLGTPPSFPGSFAGGPGVGMAGSATGVDTFIPGRSTSSAGVPAGAGDGDPRAIGLGLSCRPCELHSQCPSDEFCYYKQNCRRNVCHALNVHENPDCRKPCVYHTQCQNGEYCYNKHPCRQKMCQVPT